MVFSIICDILILWGGVCGASFLLGLVPALLIAIYWKVSFAVALFFIAPVIGLQCLQLLAFALAALYFCCVDCYKTHIVGENAYIKMFY